ncbi:MAG TPA: ABC transporter permease [Vicinamibacterales bacterium]|jgi:putative ABC transport system permease protein|nr:ABC transporter permease [Vicinamibacterales bacterium]
MKFADWLLARALKNDAERDMVLGDLQEELPRRGRVWYARQALSIAAHALVRPRGLPGEPHRSGDFFMRILLRDVKYAWRSLMKRPLLTLTVAGTLGLGLGANAAIFNLIDRLVLRPYPLDDPDRVLLFAETGPGAQYKKDEVAPANFYDWRAAATTTEFISAYSYWDANLVDRNDPERLQGYQITAGLFEALSVKPALGRSFVRDDETFGRNNVVIISDVLWKRRFDRDPAVIGRRVIVDGGPSEIVGVMPPRFNFPEGSDIWAPLSFDPKTPPSRTVRYVTAIARLKAGRTIADAQAEMSLIAARLARGYPEDRGFGVRAYTLTRGMLDEGTGPMLSLWQASAFIVLLIACANIANLLLARAAERRRETAVRLALGAGRGDILRELLTESTLLALAAVPGAIAFAWLSLYAIRVSMPANILRFVPGFESLGPDLRLVSFTIALALLTALIFGLLPALRAGAGAVAETLKEGGRTSSGRQLLRRSIVIAEIAIALPLLVTAGLGVLGTRQFLSGPQGYDPDGLLTMKLVLQSRAYPDPASLRLFVDKTIAAVQPIAGVENVSIINNMPSSGGNASRRIDIDGHPAPDPKNLPVVDLRAVTPGYFSMVKIPIMRGRDFTTADREDTAPVAIVSESMARKFWPNDDPIGRRFRTPAEGPMTVVGICGDIIHDWFNRRNTPTMYRPYRQLPTGNFAIMMRTPGDPSSLAAPVRRALLGVDPTQPVFEVMTMRRALHERTIGLQYLVAVMTVFAGIALVLASVGLYALISYLVAQRRHEIGLRIALGASRAQVLQLTIGQAFRLTIAGTAIGLVLAIALSRLIQAGLIGVGSSDARVFVAFAGVLIATALLAGYVPARRAAAIDPMAALRTE